MVLTREGLVSGPEVARLDKGGISRDADQLSGDEGLQLPLWWHNREELRGHHAKIVRLLRGMDAGEHGFNAQVVACKWLHDLERCPGVLRWHGPCGEVSFCPFSCDFQLCPWCQHRRADKYRRKLLRVVGLLQAPKLMTFNPPNVVELTGGAVSAIGSAFGLLLDRKVLQGVCGGVRSIETTHGRNGWNLHLHALVDSSWVAHYPQTDIRLKAGWESEYPRTDIHVRRRPWKVVRYPASDIGFVAGGWVVTGCPSTGIEYVGRVLRGKVHGPWEVVKGHAGLAREFTDVCQRYPELRSPRLDFNLDNPDHWYFVDIRQADAYGAVDEVVKYLAKGSEIVNGGAGAVVDFLEAFKGRRTIQPFGSLYDVDLEREELSETDRLRLAELVDQMPGLLQRVEDAAAAVASAFEIGDVVAEAEAREELLRVESELEEAKAEELELLEEEAAEAPEAPGECPYRDCPSPSTHEWEFVAFGPPVDGTQLDRDPRTGSYRLVYGRDGPGAGDG